MESSSTKCGLEGSIKTLVWLIEVRAKPDSSNEVDSFRLTLKELWSRLSVSQGPIFLETDQYKALLRLEEIVRWD